MAILSGSPEEMGRQRRCLLADEVRDVVGTVLAVALARAAGDRPIVGYEGTKHTSMLVHLCDVLDRVKGHFGPDAWPEPRSLTRRVGESYTAVGARAAPRPQRQETDWRADES